MPQTSHGATPSNNAISTTPYTSAQPGKKSTKNKAQLKKVQSGVGEAKKFLKKDHHDSNMVVAVRVRPLSNKEIAAKDFEIIQPQDKLIIVLDRIDVENEQNDKKPDVLHRSREQRYFFDRIFNCEVSTQDVYSRTCAQLIPSVINGYNACVFAYGTTGSGKTYTMTGNVDQPGIMVLILKDLFQAIQ